MSTRRAFIRSLAAASAGAASLGANLGALAAAHPVPQAASGQRREVTVAGKRVKTIDIHAHCNPNVSEIVKGTILERSGGGAGASNDLGGQRLKAMDGQGIDVEALSINAFWYAADQDLARKLIDFQNQKLADLCAQYPGRFVGFTSVALQFPDLAAQQMEDGIKHLGLHGAAIGENVNGEELSSRRFDPFWAKAQELDALIFLHPQSSAEATGITNRVKGPGALSNVIGNPLESTIALSHLIFDGTFDRFPNLKICTAHGGGFLPSYVDRMDHGCTVVPGDCKNLALQMKPSEYIRKMYFDSLVFTAEGLRHLVANTAVTHVMVGTDYPFPWVTDPIGHILSTPSLSDADKIAILGANASQLLNLPA
jgi:predicted TIM-barrel fold metal-dependent hydrolase